MQRHCENKGYIAKTCNSLSGYRMCLIIIAHSNCNDSIRNWFWPIPPCQGIHETLGQECLGNICSDFGKGSLILLPFVANL